MVKVDLIKIEAIVKEIIEKNNFRFYDIQFNNVSRTLKIYIDHQDRDITIKDCEKISGEISQKLDNLDLINFHYTLEVSSPGIERILTRHEHFQWAIGKLAEIRLKDKKLRGYIRKTDGDSVTVALSDGEIVIPLKDIIKANLAGEFDYDRRR